MKFVNKQGLNKLLIINHCQDGPKQNQNIFSFTFFSGWQKPHLKANGFCEDETNNEVCDYDGGDCCGINVYTSQCSVCECLDPNYGGGSSGEKENSKIKDNKLTTIPISSKHWFKIRLK